MLIDDDLDFLFFQLFVPIKAQDVQIRTCQEVARTIYPIDCQLFRKVGSDFGKKVVPTFIIRLNSKPTLFPTKP